MSSAPLAVASVPPSVNCSSMYRRLRYGGVHNSSAASIDAIRTGYSYGGGLAYAIPTTSFVNVFHSSAVTLKGEYLHYDSAGVNTGTVNGSSRIDGNLVRGRINYKLDLFGTPPRSLPATDERLRPIVLARLGFRPAGPSTMSRRKSLC